jgi:hypothetical protein
MFTKKNKFHFIPLTALLLAIFLPIIGLAFLSLAPNTALAATSNLTLQVPIPTLNGGNSVITFNGTTAPIAQYVKAIYTYAVGAVGIVAAVVLMIGGLMWITAGGNASSVSEAKTMITASITGLVLVMTSYLLLSQVSPSLVNLQSTIIPTPNAAPVTTATTKCVFSTFSSFKADCQDKKNYDDWCTCQNDNSWKFVSDACSDTDSRKGVCCCPALPEGCTDYSIPCQNCSPNCGKVDQVSAKIDCKSLKSCQASSAILDKLKIFSDKLKNSGISIEITEAWPPTVEHAMIGHQNGNCIDLNPWNREDDKNKQKVETIYSALVSAGFSDIRFECFPSDGCSCPTYNNQIVTKCGITETGKKAGGNNHFHVCN